MPANFNVIPGDSLRCFLRGKKKEKKAAQIYTSFSRRSHSLLMNMLVILQQPPDFEEKNTT